MSIDELLARDGLPAADRLLVLAAVAIWRGDWPQLQRIVAAARTLARPRADLEETLLQAVLFCGFPRVVTAFEQLAAGWPVPTPPRGGSMPAAEQAAAGAQLFAGIYGRNEEAVRAMLRGCHEEFHDFVLQAAYGRILTRPHLDPRRRELIAVAVLAAQNQGRQFAGHARGALHFGATIDELREVLVSTFDAADAVQADAVETWLRHVRPTK
ncbi:MAG: carboxymuconolactone decarboxylase family protein [Planctomycetes bacterium]|jgi:4-carboxymuconolactone decarboxylase|nr:carboxymuconolactone decarboxylase family protein [Planctomycetota bacterium]